MKVGDKVKAIKQDIYLPKNYNLEIGKVYTIKIIAHGGNSFNIAEMVNAAWYEKDCFTLVTNQTQQQTNPFKIGDVVKRTKGSYNNMQIGDIDEIVDNITTGPQYNLGLALKKYGTGHDWNSFELHGLIQRYTSNIIPNTLAPRQGYQTINNSGAIVYHPPKKWAINNHQVEMVNLNGYGNDIYSFQFVKQQPNDIKLNYNLSQQEIDDLLKEVEDAINQSKTVSIPGYDNYEYHVQYNVEPSKSVCTHKWVEYLGLNEKFTFCSICDEKKK